MSPGPYAATDDEWLEGIRSRPCGDGCNGCDECTDYYCGDEYGDEPYGPPEFGCCLPDGECCMPGLHFPSECHTAADYERAHPLDWRTPTTK